MRRAQWVISVEVEARGQSVMLPAFVKPHALRFPFQKRQESFGLEQ
jgi:hypothetical protein